MTIEEIRADRWKKWEMITELYNTLGVPKQYKWIPNLLEVDSYVGVSDRSRGKTTNSLLLGLCANKLFGWSTGYFRNTKEDGKKSNLDTLCQVINEYGYVKKLYPQYDRIVYHYMGGYFCLLNDETGDESEPVMYKFIVDEYVSYLGRNEINCNMFVYDEFMHDEYKADRFIHFLSLHKTLSRERTDILLIMISNTTNINHPYLKELGLNEVVKKTKRGQNKIVKLEKGTLIRFEIFGNIVEEIASNTRNIVNQLYYGFNNPRISVITGDGNDWGTSAYDPIRYRNDDKVIFNRAKLRYNLQTYSLTIVRNSTEGIHLNIKPYNDPIKDNMIIYTDSTPTRPNEFYGVPRFLKNLIDKKKVFYNDCYTGDDIRAFINTVRIPI